MVESGQDEPCYLLSRLFGFELRRIHCELRRERYFVWNADPWNGLARARSCFGIDIGRRSKSSLASSLTLHTNPKRAFEVDLRESPDAPPCLITVPTSVRCRVNDHIDTVPGKHYGDEDKGAVNNMPLLLSVFGSRCENLSQHFY